MKLSNVEVETTSVRRPAGGAVRRVADPAGGPESAAERRRGDPDARRSGASPSRPPPADGTVLLTVADNGEGILPENLAKIFDPFFTTKSEGKGVGLGLAVSYGIIQAHGGDIEVKSQPGEGTTFTVSLPLEQQPAPASEPPLLALAAEGMRYLYVGATPACPKSEKRWPR